MHILTFTSLFPNGQNPDFGVFVKNRLRAIGRLPDVQCKVVAPVPYFPPLKVSAKWYAFSQIPRYEVIDAIEIHHPRYLVTPKVGMTCYGLSMFWGSLRTVKKLHVRFRIDVIDAHFVFPDGFAAILLGRALNKPVVVSARGSDITLGLRLPLVNRLIGWTLQRADRVIAVSASLRDLMVDHGTDSRKITVIPNGVDGQLFYPLDRDVARRALGLPADARIVLTVCSLVELKGVNLLIEAAALLRARHAGPFLIVVVGAGPERERLHRQIAQAGLSDTVQLVGAVPNRALVTWYNAADLFFLGSSREGWPNVVCEALACGTPVVATKVSGIPEIVDHDGLGLLVERTPEAFAEGIMTAMQKHWDREFILERGRRRNWEEVAREVHALFEGVVKG